VASIVVLLIVVVVAWAIVTVGATAYELTGLDRDTARFQALSAFTGSGFTTRVSELVVRHPTRRKITSGLIILGYGGTASVIASLLSSFSGEGLKEVGVNLVILVVAGAVLSFVLSKSGQGLGDRIRRFLTPRLTGQHVPHEELMLYKRGYGISRIEIPRDSALLGKRLRDVDLRALEVQVLAVEEGHDVHAIPDPDWTFAPGQHIIVYGNIKALQTAFGPRQEIA